MEPYTQPKRALSGGFDLAFALTTAAVTQSIILAPQTTPADHPKKHYLHVQRLRVVVRTGSAAKTWTFQDTNGSPVALTPALDMSTAGTVFSFDFGRQGRKLTLNKDLSVVISAAGAAGDIYVEGFYERDTTTGTYIMAFAGTPVTPTSGAAAGGTAIRVFGKNFRPGCTVTVGAIAATKIRVNVDDGQSGASLDCLTGAHAAGAVDIVVTNPDAVAVTSVSAFTYV